MEPTLAAVSPAGSTGPAPRSLAAPPGAGPEGRMRARSPMSVPAWPRLAFLLIAPALAACAALPAAAEDERVTLDFRLSRQVERFQSREADSLGLSASMATTGSIVMDLRVLDLPMKAPERPSLHVHGRATTTERVFVAAAGGIGSPERTMESPLLEVCAGFGIVLPLSLVDGLGGVDAAIRYEGGVVLAADTGENFMQRSMLSIGFERAGGVLDGSLIEARYGHDDLFGPTWAAGRWGARMLVLAALAPVFAPPPAAAGGPGHVSAPVRPRGAPVRGFVELELDTDGRPGADALAGRVGLALDLGGVLGGLFAREPRVRPAP